jgi:ABC-2 type transport system permease protein
MMQTHTPFPWRLLLFYIRRTLPLWAVTAIMIFLVQIAVCGIVHDNENVKTMLAMVKILPGFIKRALGGEALQLGNVTGLVAMGYQHPMVLTLYMLFAVAIPTGLLAGQVQQGTMELILTRPATKIQVYLCAAVVTILGMIGLVLTMFLGTAIGTTAYTFDPPVDLRPFRMAAVLACLAACSVSGLALLSAASFRRRNTAVGVTAAFLMVNYAMTVISPWWPWLQPAVPYNLFYYVDLTPAFLGWPWPVHDITVLGSIFALSAVAGAIIWHRRDLPL